MKEKILKETENLIYSIAKEFYAFGVPKEDLYQAGRIGVLKAYNNYVQNKNTKFSTYAYDYIKGEMYALANKKTLKINRETLNLCKKIEKLRYEEAQKRGYIPSNYELSIITNIPVSQIDNAILSAKELVYLDSEKDDERSYYETIASEENISLDDKILLYSTIELLTNEEKEIIISRYLKDQSQDTVARKLNMNQVKVSRIEKRTLNKMKNYMTV